MHFLKPKCVNFDLNVTEVCFQEPDWQISSIGSDDGLAPNRRQTLTWTNDGMCFRRIYASLGLNELSDGFLPDVTQPLPELMLTYH